eukprot:gene16287-17927_t
MAKLNVTVIYKEKRTVVEWDKSKGMRSLKWQNAKKVVKEEKLKFKLRDGEGKMLREVGGEREGRAKKGKKGRKEQRKEQRKERRKEKRKEQRKKGTKIECSFYVFICC